MLPFLPAVSAFLLAAGPGPTLAVEDTMRTEVPEVLVRAPRITLDEILDRVAHGEARRESLLADQSFTASIRLTRDVIGKRKPRLVEETSWRVYRKKPDKIRAVQLRRVEPGRRGRARADVNVEFSPGMGEEIVNFAFRPEARRDYVYRIEGRDLVGGHLVYRIAFEPRSLLDPLSPSGLVWVDTNDFVIVREEVRFARSPVPLVLRRIDRMVVERGRVGGFWVLRRVLLRVELAVPLPTLGRSFDLAVLYGNYHVNRGVDDQVFVPGVPR